MDFERTNRGTVGKITSVTARPRRTCVSRCEEQVSKEYLPVPILKKWAKTQPTEIASGFFHRVNNQQEDCINTKVRSFKNPLTLLFWGGVLYEYHSYLQWNHASFGDGEMKSQTSKQAPQELTT